MNFHVFRLKLPLLGLLLIGVAACRTTGTQDEPAEAKSAATSGLGATLNLAKEEDQSIYLKMLEVELAAGVKVPKDQLHTARALVECHREATFEPCMLRVRLMGDELSATQPLPSETAAKVWQFVRAVRPDIGQEKLVMSDITCDYIGKKSPPYSVEDVSCTVALPRVPAESVFLTSVAEELGEALRGTTPYGNGTSTVTGSIACQWLKGSPRTPCIVRSVAGGVLAEKITEISPPAATLAARALLQSMADHSRVVADQNKNAVAMPFVPPNEIMGSLTCLIDNTKIESDGNRGYVCRAKIPFEPDAVKPISS